MNKPCSVPALNGRDRFVSGEEDEYEEKHISLSGEKILSWAMVMCITSIMVFPVSASAEAAMVDLENGE